MKFQKATILLLFVTCCSPGQVTYQDFINSQIAYEKAELLQKQLNYTEAIKYYQDADRSIDNFNAAQKIAQCYMMMEEQDEALEMLKTAFRRGLPIHSLNKDLFASIWDEVEILYTNESSEYFLTVDTLLRGELNTMIALDQSVRTQTPSKNIQMVDQKNLARLKEICEASGWPGRRLLGYGRIPDPSIIVIHSNESDNLYFLNQAIRASLHNESSWFSARAIMTNLLWRFDEKGYNKLRHTYLTRNGDLDLVKSFFQLSSLGQFLDNNRQLKIELIAFQQAEPSSFNQSYLTQLNEIKKFLISKGIENDRISINDKIMDTGSDEFGNYCFGITFSKQE